MIRILVLCLWQKELHHDNEYPDECKDGKLLPNLVRLRVKIRFFVVYSLRRCGVNFVFGFTLQCVRLSATLLLSMCVSVCCVLLLRWLSTERNKEKCRKMFIHFRVTQTSWEVIQLKVKKKKRMRGLLGRIFSDLFLGIFGSKFFLDFLVWNFPAFLAWNFLGLFGSKIFGLFE